MNRSACLQIGVDLMGSDHDPKTLLDALLPFPFSEKVTPTLIGPLSLRPKTCPFPWIEASEVIGMEEHPLVALRRKKKASMFIGMRLLKEGKIAALVSAGNTGALVSSAKMILSNLPKILRPALLTFMPTKKNPIAVLDVGANVQCKACHLLQFASIGAAFQKMRGIPMPRVGLLNIGSEPLKGTSELRLAYHELQKPNPHFAFAGNIEGTNVFKGEIDVLVTEGLTGNVLLKTTEGIIDLLLENTASLDPSPAIFGPASLDYTEYPGAILAGVQGIVIKCHGYCTPKAIFHAIEEAGCLAEQGFVKKLGDILK